AILWCLTRLPYGTQVWLGSRLGRMIMRLASGRRRIVRTNLQLCFPELDEPGVQKLERANFESMGIALFEMGMSWWSPNRKLAPLFTVEGMENLEQALASGNGAILLSAHFTTMEIGGRMLAMRTPFQVLYRGHKNAAMEYVISRGRNRFTHKAMLRDNLLGMRRSLRQNIPVWYAPDQDFGIGKAAFVPFFGIPAATLTVTSTLARMAKSPVVPFLQTRLDGARGYRLTLYPALEDFPGASPKEDTRRINAFLEARIREQPEQYLWAHRRFKTRPPGEPPVYRGR
ncbi:MAG: LpxL/LpxP family Kdo(2)-lipid IV(A) lauroyl/palmitoleoyl acyltransferase, partial [Thiohalobacterales bacterium]|nr:LpxL/LpxP family Kdo(2)-lipid IV(A) lauroyl/palmitoleoyl acyltransferase [Thiohalobacterales bacterium]